MIVFNIGLERVRSQAPDRPADRRDHHGDHRPRFHPARHRPAWSSARPRGTITLPVPGYPYYLRSPSSLRQLPALGRRHQHCCSCWAFGWFFLKTRGWASRCARSPTATRCPCAMGINVERLLRPGLGDGWASSRMLGGVLWGSMPAASTPSSPSIGLKVFPVVILGGLDSMHRASWSAASSSASPRRSTAGFIDPYGRRRHQGLHALRADDHHAHDTSLRHCSAASLIERI